MDRFQVIFNNLECSAVESSEAGPTKQNRQKRIAELRRLASKTKQSKTARYKDASRETPPPIGRVLFRYDLERVGVNGVVAEGFGRRCRGSKVDEEEQGRETKKEFNLNDDEFWSFVFSDQWDNYTGLRVRYGNVLNRLLVTLDRLTGRGDDRLLSCSVSHYVTDADDNASDSGSIPVRMEFTFYGKKVAKQPIENRVSSEGPAGDQLLPTDVLLELQVQPDVRVSVTDGAHDEGIQDVRDPAIDNQGALGIQDGEQTEMAKPIFFHDSSPIVDDVSKYHKGSAVVAKSAPPREISGTPESPGPEVTDDTSSVGSATEEGSDSPSQSPTTKGKKKKRRGKKKKKKKKEKEKKKKKGESEETPEEEVVEMVYDDVVFHLINDVKRKSESAARKSSTLRGSITTDKNKIQRTSRVSKISQQIVTSPDVVDRVSPFDLFEKRSQHARANFPSFEEYICERQKKRTGEMCRKKAFFKGAVLTTDICPSDSAALNSKAAEEAEELDEAETKELEQSTEDGLQIKSVEAKISPADTDSPDIENDKPLIPIEQKQSLKEKEKLSLQAEKKQSQKGTQELSIQIEKKQSLKGKEKLSIGLQSEQSQKGTQESSIQIEKKQSLKGKEKLSIQAEQNKSQKGTEESSIQIEKKESLKGTEKSSMKIEQKQTLKKGGKLSIQQKQSLKETHKSSIQSEVQQRDNDKENPSNKLNPTIIVKEDEKSKQSDKSVDKQTGNAFIEVQRGSRKTTKRIDAVSARDRDRQREIAKKERAVPTMVAIGQLGRSMTTWIINDPVKWRTRTVHTETEIPRKSGRDIDAMMTSDFDWVIDFPGEADDADSSNDDPTEDISKPVGDRASSLRAGATRKESAKSRLSKKSKSSSDYARRSKAALEELQRGSTRKTESKLQKSRSSKLDKEVEKVEAKKDQPQKKGKGVGKKVPSPTIHVEKLRRSQINEWDVDEDFLRLLLEATERFEVRKECISFISDRMQTMQFVTFTRPFLNTYC